MEANTLYIYNLCPSTPPLKMAKTIVPSMVSYGRLKMRRGKKGEGIGCLAMNSGIEGLEEEENEWMKTGRLREKCKERKGVVEVLECLEKEAIMGEDEGKEARDYNRRAKIFDKSSRIFQALKDAHGDGDVDTTQHEQHQN